VDMDTPEMEKPSGGGEMPAAVKEAARWQTG